MKVEPQNCILIEMKTSPVLCYLIIMIINTGIIYIQIYSLSLRLLCRTLWKLAEDFNNFRIHFKIHKRELKEDFRQNLH